MFTHLERIGRGAGGEIQHTDGLVKLIGGHRPFHGLRFAGQRFDCGDKVGFLQANIAFALAREDMAPELRKILAGYRWWEEPPTILCRPKPTTSTRPYCANPTS